MSAAIVRPARLSDARAVVDLQRHCYPRLVNVSAWTVDQIRGHVRTFPDGQFVVDAEGAVVGYCANLIVHGSRVLRPHTYDDATSRGTLAEHDRKGDTLYGAEIMVHPSHRRQGIGSAFYRLRFDLVRRLGLKSFVSGGRLPGYANHRQNMSPESYVNEVLDGRIIDRILSMQLRAGLRVHGVLRNYLPDPSSAHCASLLVWENPDWALTRLGSKATPPLAAPPRGPVFDPTTTRPALPRPSELRP